MIDQVKIHIRAGNGGSGANSFKGKKFTRSRHPDGGSGGSGADVIIRVDKNMRSLKEFQFKQHFQAEHGKLGSANKKKGANGRPCIIKVPPGTVVREIKNNLLLRDLIAPDEELVVARGGGGGRGNTRGAEATAGFPGEEKELFLELKLVADVAIVGCPNSGKSTLLTEITEARPKIAGYPFTTVSPFLGVVEFPDFIEPSILTIVEIPALIKDSHRGKGLGNKFLRHTERARVLIHIIDMADQQDGPLKNYQTLNQELKTFNQRLINKPQIAVANKMDLPQAESNIRNFSPKIKEKVYPVSALEGVGIKELLDGLRDCFR